MQIRKEFLSASEYLERLVQYADAFSKNNLESWPHYKNREDFEKVYLLDYSVRRKFEKIYETGRDCAVALSQRLVAFDQVDKNPTLTSFIKSLEGGWLYEIGDLADVLMEAKEAAKKVDHCPWSVGQMIALFEEQIRLLKEARKTIDLLKQTTLYKTENGLESATLNIAAAEQPWWEKFDSRIAVIGLVVGVIALALTAYAL